MEEVEVVVIPCGSVDGRKAMDAFQRLLNQTPAAKKAYDSVGKKRVLAGRCLLCPSTDLFVVAMFAPNPGAALEHEGRVVFYGLCKQHQRPDPQEVEGLLSIISRSKDLGDS